jgi:hypothetical protein
MLITKKEKSKTIYSQNCWHFTPLCNYTQYLTKVQIVVIVETDLAKQSIVFITHLILSEMATPFANLTLKVIQYLL